MHKKFADIFSPGTEGDQGITGAQGAPGVDSTVTIVAAGESINGHHIVTRESGSVHHADKDTLSHQSQVLGLSTNAGVIASDITVITQGYVIEPSWSWTPDKPLFLGSNGLMTDTPPTTGFLIQVAQSISSTEVWISVKMGISLQ